MTLLLRVAYPEKKIPNICANPAHAIQFPRPDDPPGFRTSVRSFFRERKPRPLKNGEAAEVFRFEQNRIPGSAPLSRLHLNVRKPQNPGHRFGIENDKGALVSPHFSPTIKSSANFNTIALSVIPPP